MGDAKSRWGDANSLKYCLAFRLESASSNRKKTMAYQSGDAVKCPIIGVLKPLPENQLPTYLHVMKAFLYERPILKLERKNSKLPLREIAAEVAQKVEAIWRKGNTPTVSHTRIVQFFFDMPHKKYRF